MTRVAAIITCYNQGMTLVQTVESILNQTFQDVMITIVDDGSTDQNTLELLRQFDHPQIQVLQKSNDHVSAARNFGILNSHGDYVLVLDSDDRFTPTFLEQAVSILDAKPGVGMVSSWIKTTGLAEWYVKPEGGDVIHFLHKNNCPGQAIFRRTCWEQAGGYNETMKAGYEDWDFNIAVTKHGWTVEIIQEYCLLYHISASSSNIQGYLNRPVLARQIVSRHRELFCAHIDEVIFQKEQVLMDRNSELQSILLYGPGDRLDHPHVSFGDGGIAFQVNIENRRQSK